MHQCVLIAIQEIQPIDKVHFPINYIGIDTSISKIYKQWDKQGRTPHFIDRHILDKSAYKWVIDYVYGLDNEHVLATACQKNLILHGNGNNNIYNADGLGSFKGYEKAGVTGAANIMSSNIVNGADYYSKESLNKFDFIISNPPFNVNFNKSELQDNFTIKGKSEAYFLER